MSIPKVRSAMYLMAKLLGDVSAIQRGRVGKRIWSRVIGKLAGRLLGRLRIR